MTTKQEFSHTADGGDPLSRVKAAGYFPLGGGGTAGENLYQSPQSFTATEAVTWWMGSPPHKAEIMNPNYEEGGVAICAGTVKIDGIARSVNIAVIHFGASHPVLNIGTPSGTLNGGTTTWKISGSASDNIDPPDKIKVEVTLLATSGAMVPTGLPTAPLTVAADGSFSFEFDTTGAGRVQVSIGATDQHGNSPKPETRGVRINP